MKKYILLSLIISFALSLNATIYHVDNKPNRPTGYYADVNIAMTNASAGDTLFIYPSNIKYGNSGAVTITKKLHFIGAGYDGTTNFNSMFQTISLDTTTSPSSNPSGSSFQGLTVNALNSNKPNINNITINGNNITYYIGLNTNNSGWMIENNFIAEYVSINNNSNISILNNVFKGSTYCLYSSSSSSVVISHNLFMTYRYFHQVFNATVSNNIFICTSATSTSYMNNNVFVNNISWQSSATPYPLPPANNTGTGNISNQDPLFETGLSSGYFDYTKDYHLKSTSPAKNAASDGTDIGPYGGTNPFVWGGAFTIPAITEMYIKNPVVNQGTSINIKVKAKKADL